MRIKKRNAENKRNPVSSLITAFVGSNSIESFDGTTRLSYWEPRWFKALHECIEYYSGMHYYGSDLQRTAEEPGFLASLSKRHPVRTMNDEKPQSPKRNIKQRSSCSLSERLSDSMRRQRSHRGIVHLVERFDAGQADRQSMRASRCRSPR